ncbi:uncharacterized protein [Oscarella lobularis]|uniref:uncharacterized protein n=1 Tax=Oscarella lobularis TaxID=121494 RepID=UPI003313F5FA
MAPKLVLSTAAGQTYTVSENTQDLASIGAFTRARSQDGKWILYKDVKYNRPNDDEPATNKIDDFRFVDPTDGDVDFDGVRSAYLLPDSDEAAVFFYDNYYGGPREVVVSSKDIFDLANPDGISSMIILGGTFQLFNQPNQKGLSVTKSQGNYATPCDMGMPNDSVKSVTKLD